MPNSAVILTRADLEAMLAALADRVGPWRHAHETFATPSQDWLFRALASALACGPYRTRRSSPFRTRYGRRGNLVNAIRRQTGLGRMARR